MNVKKNVIKPSKAIKIIDFKEVFEYRDLLFFMVLKEVKVIYKQTILGFAWAVIRPLFSMVVFTIIFSKMANMPSDGAPYQLFSFIAIVPWTYFSTSMICC